VNDVEMKYDRTGRSEGTAIVTYARFLDAQDAVTNLHLRTLDGTTMKVRRTNVHLPKLTESALHHMLSAACPCGRHNARKPAACT
jgi:RNA recognition motif-containing protein